MVSWRNNAGMKWKVLSMLLTLTGFTSQSSLLKHTNPKERRMSVQRERKRNKVKRGLANKQAGADPHNLTLTK